MLVIFGKVGGGNTSRCIHGGAAFVWPLTQDFAFLSLEPIQIEIPLKGALSAENIRVSVPSVFTVAIGTEPEVMNNAAIRLLRLSTDEIKQQAGDIIFGQLRQVIASCTETWNPERIGALAMYCSDGRWGEAFDEFCHKRLLLPRYDRWAVPGGPACLVPGATRQDLLEGNHEQIALLVRVHELKQIVLITHYGCAYYRERLGRASKDCLDEQMADLRTVRAELLERFPDLQVSAYVAMQNGRRLSFHQMD